MFLRMIGSWTQGLLRGWPWSSRTGDLRRELASKSFQATGPKKNNSSSNNEDDQQQTPASQPIRLAQLLGWM